MRIPTLLALAIWLPSPLMAQEPEAGVGAALNRCTLRWRPIEPDTRSITNRDVTGAHVTHLSGRYLWTCGGARMEADSAIKRDGPRQVELLGGVVYEDSIRMLNAERLLYFQRSDFIIAEENVELVRLTDASTLTGPRVEFLRAVSGVDAVTTAPGRPAVTFYPANTESPEPFEIQSDFAIFAGEDEARFYGDAVIDRSDLRARGDSALLTRTNGLGVLWGESWIEAEGIRLEGDSIRFLSQNQELEEIHAIGNGYASGERFEVEADLIDIDLQNREVEDVQAHGEGASRALSGNHQLHGDSIHFVMYGSQIDTAYAIGGAIAVQRDSSWIVPPEPAAPDSTATDSAAVDSAAAESSVADSAAATPDAADPTAAESAPAAEPDSTAAAAMSPAAADSAQARADTTEAEVGEEGPEVELPTDGSANWARGDTLIAVFERSEAPVADPTAAPDPFMSQLVIGGNASAFYRLVRDSATSARPSLNYLLARRIQVDFLGGEPVGVDGEHAIGAYLEPREAFGTPSPPDGAAAADSLAAADSAAVADSAAAADSTRTAASDSLRAARDASDVRPDSATARQDTVSAPPDTVSSRGHPGRPGARLALRIHSPGRERRVPSAPVPAHRPRRLR